MVFDLGKAMRKKEEFESARLMDFEFRQRARALRLIAARLALAEPVAIGSLAILPDVQLRAELARLSGVTPDQVTAHLQACMAEARRQLIAEQGDPSPIRLG